jgi:hypothetical protein
MHSLRSSNKITLATCSIVHGLHDGLTASVYVLLPVLAQTFGLSYAQISAIRVAHSGSMWLLEIPAGILSEPCRHRSCLHCAGQHCFHPSATTWNGPARFVIDHLRQYRQFCARTATPSRICRDLHDVQWRLHRWTTGIRVGRRCFPYRYRHLVNGFGHTAGITSVYAATYFSTATISETRGQSRSLLITVVRVLALAIRTSSPLTRLLCVPNPHFPR